MNQKAKFRNLATLTLDLQRRLDPEIALIIIEIIEEKGVDMTTEILSAIANFNAESKAANAELNAKIDANNAKIDANNAEIRSLSTSVDKRLDGIKDKVDAVKHFNLFTVTTTAAAIIAAVVSMMTYFK